MKVYGYKKNKCKQELDTVKVSATQPTTNDKVWIQKGKNLFNSNGLPSQTNLGITATFNNSELTLNGTSTGAGYLYAQKVTQIKLPAGHYTFSTTLKSGSLVSNGNGASLYLKKSGTDTIITNVSLIHSSREEGSSCWLEEETTLDLYAYINGGGTVYSNVVYQIQLEPGETITEYEAYIKPKIHIKNDNDVYEEFISKDNLINYSTGEKLIGTWIDGKKIYARQFVVSSPKQVNTEEVVLKMPDDTSGVARIIAQLWSESVHVITPVPYYFNSDNYGSLFYKPLAKEFSMKVTLDNYANAELLIYVEYTKTTD